MIDIILGISLISLGFIWLIYHIKNKHKPSDIVKEPMNWVYNFNEYKGSLLLILLGSLFLFQVVSILDLFK